MKTKIKAILTVICAVASISLCGCESAKEGLDSLTTNTTVDEATVALTEINSAIMDANQMVRSKDSSVYGDLVHTDTVSFKNVVAENDLEKQVATKRIDGVSYHLYWDNDANYPFWSTDGIDDIRNTKENFHEITHDDSIRIKNKTNISELN
ncbi:MAG: hypothetical protein UHK60_04510 [Acutalibacteraceae bacterium]|nr:hypothetical protein [Acutalibacteraceae bacterium]